MRAAITRSYGTPDVLEIRDVPTPTLSDADVLVQVHASPVTAGDRRLRAADFPSISAVPGRLMLGVFGPRKAVQGTMFAGRVVAVGRAVTRFAVGDDVFGSSLHGAYADFLAMPEGGAIARMPAGLAYDEAAAIPYGAFTALHFLRSVGKVGPGQKVLLLGASGGVGLFAVQIAKHLGAHVTAVCGRRSVELVRELGADEVLDYAHEDFARQGERYDVIFDVAGVTTFSRAREALTANGRYMTLLLSVGHLLQVAWTSIVGGQRALFGVAMGGAADMEELRELVERGAIRPVVAHRYPLEHIAEAHAEASRAPGAIVVTLAG
jgi:NADPH:quinone reductase-like Zn-dependent oxidoreductase